MTRARAIEVLQLAAAGARGWTAVDRDDAFALAAKVIGRWPVNTADALRALEAQP